MTRDTMTFRQAKSSGCLNAHHEVMRLGEFPLFTLCWMAAGESGDGVWQSSFMIVISQPWDDYFTRAAKEILPLALRCTNDNAA